MAIDDNTLYGLTGAQVKELPGKIEAIKGKAKVLTTADYNWPVSNPTSVALWLLPSGIYTGPEDGTFIDAKITSSANISLGASYPGFVIVSKAISDSNQRANILYVGSTRTYVAHGVSLNGTSATYESFLSRQNDIVDALNSTSTTTALSANQGKVLKDFIGDLTNLTTTDKTNLVAAINEAAAGGGGGPTVVQTTGTSTTDVMSQNAVTSMVFADPGTNSKIRIGSGTVGSATAPVVIGRAASVRGNYAVAIGSGAGSQVTNAPGGISLGAFSTAAGQGQMDISLATATPGAQAAYGYNGSAYRLLTGLYDPQSAHDAATKGYVDTAVAGAGASAFTTNEWNALWA